MTPQTARIRLLLALLPLTLFACGEDVAKQQKTSGNTTTNNTTTNNTTTNNTTNNSTTNVEIPATCGNGELNPGETCDPLIESGAGVCPDSCDAPACFTSVLVGDTLGCTARCVTNPVSCSMISDECCPLGCSAETDSDCENTCGNGIVEAGESCDGNCPTTCDDENACTTDSFTGSTETCSFQCTNTPRTTCVDGDGCCPAGCSTANDSDCSSTCGNGILDAGETCDGNCPTTCSDNIACTADTATGSAATCSVQCSHAPITTCQSDDGCCPGGCTSQNDNDCVCVPTTSCAAQGKNCGVIFNGCAATACGACTPDQSCQNDVCVGTAPVGEACASNAECQLGPHSTCFTEAFIGLPGGYCTIACDAGQGTCSGDSICADTQGFGKFCADTCTSNADCRNGYTCYDALGNGTLLCWL